MLHFQSVSPILVHKTRSVSAPKGAKGTSLAHKANSPICGLARCQLPLQDRGQPPGPPHTTGSQMADRSSSAPAKNRTALSCRCAGFPQLPGTYCTDKPRKLPESERSPENRTSAADGCIAAPRQAFGRLLREHAAWGSHVSAQGANRGSRILRLRSPSRHPALVPDNRFYCRNNVCTESATDSCRCSSHSPFPHCAASLSLQTLHRFGYGSSDLGGMERFSRGALFLGSFDPIAWARGPSGEKSVSTLSEDDPSLYGVVQDRDVVHRLHVPGSCTRDVCGHRLRRLERHCWNSQSGQSCCLLQLRYPTL